MSNENFPALQRLVDDLSRFYRSGEINSYLDILVNSHPDGFETIERVRLLFEENQRVVRPLREATLLFMAANLLLIKK